MRFLLLMIVLVGIGTAGFLYVRAQPSHDGGQTAADPSAQPQGPQERAQEYVVAEGDTFTTALAALGIDYAAALAILEASKEAYDFTSIRIGRPLRLVSLEGTMVRLEYEPGTESMITVDFLEDGEFAARREAIAYEVSVETVEGTVRESLYKDGLLDGVDELLILNFAEIFAWTVDFAVEVREGDRYRIVYERRSRDGEPAGVGAILAASYENAGKTSVGYRFVHLDGSDGYYDEEGNSLERAFLKAPLSYSRITSGFTYARFHPTLKTVTPHRAIDYAAPIGTPIMAVADGTIRHYSWNGGYGNFVSIRHNERFTTNYAHLVRFAKGLGVGSRVSQGDIIGYVGSTGFSTGPHLHYEIEEFGAKVNPLEVELPPGDEVPEEERAAFEAERDRLAEILLE